MRHKKYMLLYVVTITLALAIMVTAGDLITYQGRLTTSTGAPVTDGVYTLQLALYADSTGGTALWQETAMVSTHDGLFSHLLGSQTPLPATIFANNDILYLQLTVNGDIVLPRTRLTTVPVAVLSKYLKLTDDSGTVYIASTFNNGGSIQLSDSTGNPTIELHGGLPGDSSVILPDSAINTDEILNEPGIAIAKESAQIELSTGTMTDLVTLDITIPDDGYIVLYGKCYLLLSGTTGANSARIQIDEEEGGTDLFPYYTQAGLGGYVNTEVNYFPIYVTRTYYKTAGTYTFRMEGRAINPLPAVAKTWDHILTATYFSTSYGWVSGVATNPSGHPEAIPFNIGSNDAPDRTGIYYNIDLRTEERKNKNARSGDAIQ